MPHDILLGSLSGLAVPASIFSYYTVVDRKVLTPWSRSPLWRGSSFGLAASQQMRWSSEHLLRHFAVCGRRLQQLSTICGRPSSYVLQEFLVI